MKRLPTTLMLYLTVIHIMATILLQVKTRKLTGQSRMEQIQSGHLKTTAKQVMVTAANSLSAVTSAITLPLIHPISVIPSMAGKTMEHLLTARLLTPTETLRFR